MWTVVRSRYSLCVIVHFIAMNHRKLNANVCESHYIWIYTMRNEQTTFKCRKSIINCENLFLVFSEFSRFRFSHLNSDHHNSIFEQSTPLKRRLPMHEAGASSHTQNIQNSLMWREDDSVIQADTWRKAMKMKEFSVVHCFVFFTPKICSVTHTHTGTDFHFALNRFTRCVNVW